MSDKQLSAPLSPIKAALSIIQYLWENQNSGSTTTKYKQVLTMRIKSQWKASAPNVVIQHMQSLEEPSAPSTLQMISSH